MHEASTPISGQEKRPPRLFSWLACAAALALAIALLVQNRFFFHDDAFITLRYADNLLAGNGLVWNPGERVQGYTNFLFLVLVAGQGALGIELTTAARVVGFVSLAGIVAVVGVFGARMRGARAAGVASLPVVLVMTSAPLLVWTLGGLEGPLLALLATVGCLALVHATESGAGRAAFTTSGLFFALGSLTRPDGVLFVGVSLAWLLSKRARRAHVLAFLTPIALVLVPFAIWQWSYYGELVPNTFHVKMGLPPSNRMRFGLRYLIDYATRPPYLPILTLVSLASAGVLRVWSSKLSYLTLATGTYLVFVVVAGGDHMRAFRFLVPVIGLMSVTIGLAVSSIAERWPSRALQLAVVAVLGLSVLQLGDRKLNARVGDPAANAGMIVGLHIEANWPAGSLVALNTAGSTPFIAREMRFIDMLGLNDRHIARREIEEYELPWQRAPGHAKGDGKYVLDREPDYIVIGPAEGSLITKPWFLSDLEISRDPRFSERYERVRVLIDNFGRPVEENGALLFTYYRRKDAAAPGARD